MATTNKEDCPAEKDKLPNGARYQGDCQDCEHFMGCKFNGTPEWGDRLPGCCWLKLQRALIEKAGAASIS